MAPREGISDEWLCQPYFRIAAKAAVARGALLITAQRGRRAKAEGIDRCQSQECNRQIGRNNEMNERPGERPRPGISDRWLCINCYRKAGHGTLRLSSVGI
jgi:hypothetical protein